MKLALSGTALIGLSMVSNLLALTGPIFMLQVYDRVLASGSVPTLVALGLLATTLYAFSGFLDALRGRLVVRLAAAVEAGWSPRLFRNVLAGRLAGAAGPDPIRDLDTVRQVIAGGAPTALLDLPWMPVYLVIVYLLHPLLGLAATLGAVVIVALALGAEFALRRSNAAVLSATSRRQEFDSEARNNAEAIRAMGMSGEIIREWGSRSNGLTTAQLASTDAQSWFTSSTKTFRYFLQSALLAAGAYLVLRGEATGGIMFASSMISSRALAPVEQIVGQWRNLLAGRGALARVRKLLDRGDAPVRGVEMPMPSASLAVRDLVTGPTRQSGALLQGVSFALDAGDGLGVLGLSGSGKSTLLRALLGIWPTLHGDIRFDGATQEQYDPERLGQAIGYLPQGAELFSGTIAANISRFSPAATSEAIIEAAKAAGVHDLIVSFKDGYDTAVGELGSRLSAGQRQRIGLARALYGRPFLIVLDEPNANLDAAGDDALTLAMAAARRRGAIVVVVAHRPSAIAAMNKLLFLQDGRQVAFGPKDQVLAQITQPHPRNQIKKVVDNG